MEIQQQDKVYVTVGKDEQEGKGALGWALRTWSSNYVSFVILHVISDNNSKDLVATPIGMLPAIAASSESLKVVRAAEHDELSSKYTNFCSKAKVETIKVELCEQPIQQIILGLISTLRITKLVLSSTLWKARIIDPSYVDKHKPEFCQLFMVSGGKLLPKINHNNINTTVKQSKKFVGCFGFRRGQVTSHPCIDAPKVEDVCGEDIDSYMESLLAAKAKETNEEDAVEAEQISPNNQIELLDDTDHNLGTLSRIELLKAKLEIFQNMIEEKKTYTKASRDRRVKAERAISLFNQRTANTEARMGEEVTKQTRITGEHNTVRAELKEVTSEIASNENRLKYLKAHQDQLAKKLQASLSTSASIEARLELAERAKNMMFAMVEELRDQRDVTRHQGLVFSYREFTEEELREATEGFSEELIHRADGDGGVVYKGMLNYVAVAIQFKTEFCLQSPEEFKAQVELLCQVRHPNVIAMIGACTERRCIVFEYMQHGSLHNALRTGSPHLPWHGRIRIATEVTKALGFIHAASAAHAHLTASHILLDIHLVAKISGLTEPLGVDYQSDIVRLGMLILQLATGRVEARWEEVEGEAVGAMDENAGKWPKELAEEFVGIGIQCAMGEMEMTAVVTELEAMKARVEERRLRCDGERGQDEDTEEWWSAPPSAVICPIYQEVMKQPYVAADGFSYELEAIKEWLDGGHETSPMTHLELRNKHLTPNHNLESLIDDWHRHLQTLAYAKCRI